jgi:hypothetical protein
MTALIKFQASQVVFLEHDHARLYAEVVQFVESRQLCWVRPIALVTDPEQSWTDYQQWMIQDLRDGSDLMCPARLFHEALDTEVLPLLDRLYQLQDSKPQSSELHQFIHEIWQAHPEAFQ